MAQLSGAARSTSHVPVAFAAGTLLATATIATGIILALALGVDVGLRDGAAAAQPGALAPNAPVSVADTIDLTPKPGEFRLAPGNLQPVGAAPRAGVSTYDGRLDPIERDHIFRIQTGRGIAPVYAPEPPAPAEPWQPDGGLPRYQRISR